MKQVLLGDGLKNGSIIELNQLSQFENVVSKPNSYLVFLHKGTDGLYYHLDLNSVLLIKENKVVSDIKDMEGNFDVQEMLDKVAQAIKN